MTDWSEIEVKVTRQNKYKLRDIEDTTSISTTDINNSHGSSLDTTAEAENHIQSQTQNWKDPNFVKYMNQQQLLNPQQVMMIPTNQMSLYMSTPLHLASQMTFQGPQ